MSNPENFRQIDITPDDDNLSKEAANKLRQESQPIGHEAAKDALTERYEELLRRQAELIEDFKAYGVGIPKAEEQPKITEQPKAEQPRILDFEPAPAKVEKKFSPSEVGNMFLNSKAVKAVMNSKAAKAALAVAITSGLVIGGTAIHSHVNGHNAPASTPTATEASMPEINIQDGSSAVINEAETPATEEEAEAPIETTQYSGETIHGVRYDYKEYADRPNKEAYNAYGYNYSDQYDDRDKSTEGILHMATQEPEALASYAYNIFTDEEKEELGIKDLTMVQIDDKFDQDGGGDLQKKLLDKFTDILNDKENTEFKFYHENGTEATNYVYFLKGNTDSSDINFTPDQLKLAYDTKKRDNAPQVDIYRNILNKDGKKESVKMLDLNMMCGYQPNYKIIPEGLAKIDANKPIEEFIKGGGKLTPSEGGTTVPDEPDEPKKPDPKKPWGKSGDPHAGKHYKKTKVVNPAVPDISNINLGNQGYIDDQGAIPGAASDLNGIGDNGFAASGIVADGANTDGGRLTGGENQGGGGTNGDNAYHDSGAIEQGQQQDNGGNQAQEQAHENNESGGNNNSDKQEESRVEEGDF